MLVYVVGKFQPLSFIVMGCTVPALIVYSTEVTSEWITCLYFPGSKLLNFIFVLINVIFHVLMILYIGVLYKEYFIFNNRPISQIPNAPVLCPTMHNFVAEMCIHAHISVTKWCIVGYGNGALWGLCKRSIIDVCTVESRYLTRR